MELRNGGFILQSYGGVRRKGKGEKRFSLRGGEIGKTWTGGRGVLVLMTLGITRMGIQGERQACFQLEGVGERGKWVGGFMHKRKD